MINNLQILFLLLGIFLFSCNSTNNNRDEIEYDSIGRVLKKVISNIDENASVVKEYEYLDQDTIEIIKSYENDTLIKIRKQVNRVVLVEEDRENDKKNGEVKEYYPNGILKKHIYFRDNVVDSFYIEYFKDGKIDYYAEISMDTALYEINLSRKGDTINERRSLLLEKRSGSKLVITIGGPVKNALPIILYIYKNGNKVGRQYHKLTNKRNYLNFDSLSSGRYDFELLFSDTRREEAMSIKRSFYIE